MKTVEFIKDHLYGGIPMKKGDRIELPDDRAGMLVKIKAAKLPKDKAED